VRFALISGADEEGPAIVAHGVVAALPVGIPVLMKPRVTNAVVCAGSVVSSARALCVRRAAAPARADRCLERVVRVHVLAAVDATDRLVGVDAPEAAVCVVNVRGALAGGVVLRQPLREEGRWNSLNENSTRAGSNIASRKRSPSASSPKRPGRHERPRTGSAAQRSESSCSGMRRSLWN